MSSATPTVSSTEAKHRLAVAEGLLTSVGSGPLALTMARQFLELDADPSIAEARRLLRGQVPVLRQLAEEDSVADFPGEAGPGGEAPFANDFPEPPHKKPKRRKRARKETTNVSKTIREASVTGNPPVPGSPSSQTGAEAAQNNDWGGPNGGAIQSTENAPFARTSLGEFSVPPNLREADGWEMCANCVFFLQGCNLYGRGRDGKVADMFHDGFYPVDARDVCDSHLSLTPEVQRHVGLLDREDNRLAEAARAGNSAAVLVARARVGRAKERLDATLEEMWSPQARAAAALARKNRPGGAIVSRHQDKFGTALLDRDPGESALHYAMRRMSDKPASATAHAAVSKEFYGRAKAGANHMRPGDHVRMGGVTHLQAALESLMDDGPALQEVKSDVYPGLDRSPRKNWVDKAGGLPSYIERIAKHLHYEKGKDIGTAIAIAVNVVKKMCGSGDLNFKGKQNVNAKSRAEACAAVAEWEKKKASSHVSEAFQESLALFEAAFKPIPPSWNMIEGLLGDLPSAELEEVELGEGMWDSAKHPRGKEGRFADVLAKLHHDVSGSKQPPVATFERTLKHPERSPRAAEYGLDAHHAEFGSFDPDGKRQAGKAAPADLTVDMAIGGVLGSFPNVKDWNLDDPTTDEHGKKSWLLHVDLPDKTHHISVNEDGEVKEINAPGLKPQPVPVVPKHTGDYVATGDEQVMSHMAAGTVFQGDKGEMFMHHGDTWITGKKGPVKGADIEHLEKGTHKSVPYFAVHGKPYKVFAKEGTFTPHAAGSPSSADDVFGALLKSVADQHGTVNTVSGKNVVLTGTIPGHARKEVEAMISAAGGTPHSSIGSTTHILVTGENVGATKINAAKKKGVTVVPWDEFKHLVESQVDPDELAYAQVCGRLEEVTDGREIVRLRARRDVLARRIEEKVYSAGERRANATIGDDRYPIGDAGHARAALARLNQGGLSPAEKAKVVAKARKFLGADHPLIKAHS